jgi:hypothetical protein
MRFLGGHQNIIIRVGVWSHLHYVVYTEVTNTTRASPPSSYINLLFPQCLRLVFKILPSLSSLPQATSYSAVAYLPFKPSESTPELYDTLSSTQTHSLLLRMSSSNAGRDAGRGAGRGRGGNQQNIRHRGAFFSSQGTVPGPGAPQPSTTAASAAPSAGEGAPGPSSSSSGFAGPSSHPSSSSGPMGPTSRAGSSSSQMGPPSRPSSSSGLMGPPLRPSSFSGPARRPSVASLNYMEFDDPQTPYTFTGARIGPLHSGLSAPSPVSYGTGPRSAPSPSGLVDFNAPPRPTSSAGLGHPNLPASTPVAPSPPASRVPTDAISRFMELKQFMNRLQKAAQDCHTLTTNPFAPRSYTSTSTYCLLFTNRSLL